MVLWRDGDGAFEGESGKIPVVVGRFGDGGGVERGAYDKTFLYFQFCNEG